jgi:TatD family-associated radical SAM protein
MNTSNKSPSVVYWMGNNIYVNITNKCSNNCYFCFKRFKKGIKEFNLTLDKEPTAEEAKEKLRMIINRKHWNEVVFCGFGEPLERLDVVLEVARWLKRQYLMRVRVDTNGHGYLLNKRRSVVQELKQAGVDKVSVSLNAHNTETYNQICKPAVENAYEAVIEFIKTAKEEGLETEATAVTVPEVSMTKVKDLAEKLGAKFSVREYISFVW